MPKGYKDCMEAPIQLLFAIAFIVIGVSHLAQPLAWIRLFINLREQGEPGVLLVSLVTFPSGLLIAVFHSVWTGIPLILTLIGWGFLIKGTLYLVYPKLGLRALGRLREENAGMLCWAGIGLILIGGLLAWEYWS